MGKSQQLNYKKLIGNLVLLIAIMIFISFYSSLFGKENTLVGVTIITALLMFSTMEVHLKFKDAIIAIIVSFVALGIASYVNQLHPFIGLPINFIVIFSIVYIFTADINSNLYIPFGLCYIFLQGNPVYDFRLMEIRFCALLIGGILVAVAYYFTHKKESTEDHRGIKELFQGIDIYSLHFNFALRMGVGISLAILIGSLFGLVKGYWISATVLSITLPHFHATKERMPQRLMSTIIGCIVYFILFKMILPESMHMVATLILSYIYTFINEYKIKIIFVTVNALSATVMLFSAQVSMPMRIMFVIIGIAFGYLINALIYKLYENHSENKLSNSAV